MMTYRNPVAVAYYRVSTKMQGDSRLGLEAQRSAVEALCAREGLTVREEFTEIESGGKSRSSLKRLSMEHSLARDRPKLNHAFNRARYFGGIVVVAKLDRLARNSVFIGRLIEKGIPFVCADAPNDSPFIQKIKADFAEEEKLKISERTMEAVAKLKARGKKLGHPKNFEDHPEGRRLGADRMKQIGESTRAEIRADVLAARKRGLSLRAIAEEVNYSFMTVSRIIKAADAAELTQPKLKRTSRPTKAKGKKK